MAWAGRDNVFDMTLAEQEAYLDTLGSPWSALKNYFAHSLRRQLHALLTDHVAKPEWKPDIEQAHRDNYARLIETLMRLAEKKNI
jgi:hypothetical protein